MKSNFFLNTDSYKLGHFKQYPENTTLIYEYIEGRCEEDLLFFGLQAFLKKLNESFPNIADVEFAAKFAEEHGVIFNEAGAMQLVELGYFPLRISAVKEGTVLKGGNILVSIENTHPDFEWLVGTIETSLLRGIWYPTTVATYSYNIRKLLEKYLIETQGSTKSLPFMMHDFGSRSASSEETALLGAMAHLVNFMGTDSMIGILGSMKYYNSGMSGFSVVAAEHSTITSWTEEGELESYRNLIKKFPTGILSVVSDSYDLERTVREYYGKILKQDILNRDGVFVVRPDSGNPTEIVLNVLNWLEEGFGSYKNDFGYKVLNDKVRILQGDGVDIDKISEILEEMKKQGWSAESLVFGMGTKLLQDHNRDDYSFAMKVSYIEQNGKGIDVLKNPKTDIKKKSKAGRMALILENGEHITVQESELGNRRNMLMLVYEDGELLNELSFDKIRQEANRF